MGLFSAAVTEQINQIAAKSNEKAQAAAAVNTRSMNDDLNQMSKQVVEYFKDSPAILITSKDKLHEYVDKCIEKGYAGIDTETTGLDRIHDWVVGASLYTPGQPECYIPMKHLVPLFDTPYKDQLSYEDVQEEFQRLVDNNVRLIFANADYDLAMIYKDLKVDMIPAFYYDVITAWRCLREDEKDNSLKGLYAKYVKKGQVDPKKFSDFFSPKLFPYCKPSVAALYAANDAKITYELFLWQLPYVTKTHEKCKKHSLEKIADLVWNIEFPMVAVCAHLHRRGVFLDSSISSLLHERYTQLLHKDEATLAQAVQELIDTKDIQSNRNRPFRTGADFNPNSNPHVKYLINNLLGSAAKSTDKEVLKELNQPSTKAILNVRGDVKLLSTYVDKLPKAVASDNRVHASFKAIGAATGRMCLKEGTWVNTPFGGSEIQHLRPGDKVYCYSFDANRIVQSTVEDVLLTGKDKKCITIECNGGEKITCTPEHPFLTEAKEWVNAADLKVGDHLVHIYLSYDEDFGDHYAHLNTRQVIKVSECTETYNVYDIVVEKHHNFFAEGICVHNSSENPNAQNIPSKSHDIRHMFRATPEQVEDKKVIEEDGQVEVKLSLYDSVPTPEGHAEVRNLKEGSIVIFKEGEHEIQFSVSSISFDKGIANIVLMEKGG